MFPAGYANLPQFYPLYVPVASGEAPPAAPTYGPLYFEAAEIFAPGAEAVEVHYGG